MAILLGSKSNQNSKDITSVSHPPSPGLITDGRQKENKIALQQLTHNFNILCFVSN
jgi:hypothetical protein